MTGTKCVKLKQLLFKLVLEIDGKVHKIRHEDKMQNRLRLILSRNVDFKCRCYYARRRMTHSSCDVVLLGRFDAY